MPKTNIKLKLIGEDGSPWVIMTKVKKALIEAGHSELVKPYIKEATSGDYDKLIQVTMDYVEVV